MAKLKIDDRELDTETFNETQQKIFNELTLVGSEMDRAKYMSQLLQERFNMLAQALVKEEDSKSEDQVEDAEVTE